MIETKRKILNILKKHPKTRPNELVDYTGLSRSVTQKYLGELVDDGFIVRSGKPPHTFYSADKNISEIIQTDFIYNAPEKGLLFGMDGFKVWADKKMGDIPIERKIRLYERGYEKYTKLKKDFFKFESAKDKLKNNIIIDNLYCIDLHHINIGNEITKISTPYVILPIVKGSGTKEKLKNLVDKYVYPSIERIHSFIKKHKIDAVAFVPPTNTNRPIQIMKLLEKRFKNTDVNTMPILKIKRDFSKFGGIRNEQKHLEGKTRIANARETYLITLEKKTYNRLLLVDDLIYSGSTMNEIARKYKDSKIAKEVWGIGLIGINTKKVIPVRKA